MSTDKQPASELIAASGTDNLLKAARGQRGPAPVHDWDPPYCGEMDMRIAADGRWYHEGSPIGRQTLVQLFSSILRLDDDGHFYLVTPVEKVRIRVDDCPFVAQLVDAIEVDGQPVLRFTLNTGETVDAGPQNPITVTQSATGEPHPVIEVRHGLLALINRPVFYQLVAMAEQQPAEIQQQSVETEQRAEVRSQGTEPGLRPHDVCVYSQGCRFVLGQF